MAISRSLMNRQLQANGGIMQVAPREKFGLGSKLKKFVRKIIPNEVADIAVKAAPFVAPFNPAVAAAMSGIGSFDQTGSIGDSLKRGALTYGLGQGARYLGGAGFQGNPFAADGGAFRGGLEGFKSGFSSPLGNQTGFKLGKPVEAVEGVGIDTSVPLKKPNVLAEQMSEVSLSPNNLVEQMSEVSLSPSGSVVNTVVDKSIVTKNDPGFLKNLFDGVSNQDYGKIAKTIGDGAKKFGKAMFTNKDGSIDKAAVMGAIAFAGSYAEARALAAETGLDDDLTEEEYNEALREEKKEEYAGYLTNFFGGVKDGGRIGFESGANEMIKTQLLEDIMPNTDTTTEDYIVILTEDGPKVVLRSQAPSESMLMDTTTSVFGDAGGGRRIPEELRADGGRIGFAEGTPDKTMEQFYMSNNPDANKSTYTMEDFDIIREPEVVLVSIQGSDGIQLEKMLKSDAIKYGLNIVSDSIPPGLEGETIDLSVLSKKDGGRIGLKFGTKPEEAEVGIMSIDVEAGDDDDEDMMMAAGITFSRPEKSYLFRRLGGSGGADRSYTMPNLYRILNNPNRYPEDAAILKEIAIMGLGESRADGGRIGFKDGTDESLIEKLLNSKIAQEGRYGASEFFFGDPIMFGTPDKFKDGKNDNRGTFKRDSSDYDKLSPEKQAYIEAFLNSDEGQLFLKPGKIKFPTNKKMREHNKKITLEDFNEDRNPLELLLGIDYENRAKGGRIGYKGGANRVSELLILRDEKIGKGEDVSDIEAEIFQLTGKTFRSVGGISDVPTGQMRKNNAGVVERDYRDEGGFVPVGIKERADDVPAMLSKNEFVMTADAVRGIGNGSVEEGSKKLYNTMKQAEKVGKA